MLLAVISAVAALGAPPAKVCHDAKGHIITCPKVPPVAQHCHDAKGQDIQCGLPGAKPAGLKTRKPHG
jgi:hypothetical protein